MSESVYSPQLQVTLTILNTGEVEDKLKLHDLFLKNDIRGERADFTCCQLPEGFSFKYKKLKDVRFVKAVIRNADFTGAIISGADFTNAILTYSVFTDCVMRGTRFLNANLCDTNWYEGVYDDTTSFYCCNRRKSERQPRFRFTNIDDKAHKLTVFADTVDELTKILTKKNILPAYKHYAVRKELSLRKNHASYYDFIKENGLFSHNKASRFLNKGAPLDEKEKLQIIWDLVRYKDGYFELASYKENEGRYLPINF